MNKYYRYYRAKAKKLFGIFKKEKPTLGGTLVRVHVLSTTFGDRYRREYPVTREYKKT
jgi:hypothetical protein